MTSFVTIIVIALLHISSSATWPESLEDFLKSKHYDKNMRPSFGSGQPVTITNQIDVIQLSLFRTERFTYDIEYILRQWWYDPRLARNNETTETDVDEHDHETYDRDVGIWLPRLFVENSGTSETMQDGRVAVLIDHYGKVFRSSRRKSRWEWL